MITKRFFGTTKAGEEVFAYTLTNGTLSTEILTYGAVVRTLTVPDKNGKPLDVVLGYNDVTSYENGGLFFGTFVGRFANRILDARFTIDGTEYCLEPNDGKNHLHGSYTTRVFEGETDGDALVLRLHSPDGEEGYPGAMDIQVTYTITPENGLKMAYSAVTDKTTVVNLTNHSYFNLNGGEGSILGHKLTVNAESFTEGNAETCPTGRIVPVEGTPLDFRTEKEVGRDIFAKCCHVDTYKGYDHNFCLAGDPEKPCAVLRSAESGIRMEVYTTQPGVQLYTGNFIDTGKCRDGKGVRYDRYSALCLETQHYPCSPAYPAFPSTLLHPGEVYGETTEYRFGLD